jgi:hypothetical protein
MGTMLHFRTINQTTEPRESNKFNMARTVLPLKNRVIRDSRLGWEMSPRGRFATPADFALQHCSPYSHVHARHERLGVVVQGAFSVAPCQNLIVAMRMFLHCVPPHSPCSSESASAATRLLTPAPNNSPQRKEARPRSHALTPD